MKDYRIKVKIQANRIFELARIKWGDGLTQAEIAMRCGISQTQLCDLVNFKASPLQAEKRWAKLGPWRPIAIRIATALDALPEQIWPDHLVEIRKKTEWTFEASQEDLALFVEAPAQPDDMLIEDEARQEIRRALATLAPREEKVLRMRFGLDNDDEMTLRQIGDDFEVGHERIRQIEAGALRKLRHPSHAKHLRDYITFRPAKEES